jgi:rod shape-determining protein MreC
MKKVFLTILVLVIILILLNIIPGLNKGLGNFVYKIFSPIGTFFSKVGSSISGFFQVIISISDLNEENLALKQGNLVLEAENSTLIEVKRENDILKEALSISKSGQQIKEVASVVGKDIQGIQDWILINKGSKHGIIKDMVVISPESALVGKISEVNSSFSKVTLIINKDSVVAGIVGNNRIEGLVKRDDKGGLFIDFIPKTENLEINERIITSGMDNLYPKGILIGKIEIIDTSDNQIFQKITIAPAVDFSKLEEVFIIK